jgi:hypothetical protein
MNIEFDYHEEHANRIEKLYLEEVVRFKEKIEKESEGLEGLEKLEHFECYQRDFDYLYDKIPNIQRSSELMTAYSLLETNLLRICETFEKESDNPGRIRDLNSKGYINQAKLYLEKVVRINFPSKNDTWEEILLIQNIRNSFVHSIGKVKTGNAELIKYISKSSYLELNANYQIIIKNGFTNHCLRTFKNFFDVMFSLIQDKYNSKLRLIK